MARISLGAGGGGRSVDVSGADRIATAGIRPAACCDGCPWPPLSMLACMIDKTQKASTCPTPLKARRVNQMLHISRSRLF